MQSQSFTETQSGASCWERADRKSPKTSLREPQVGLQCLVLHVFPQRCLRSSVGQSSCLLIGQLHSRRHSSQTRGSSPLSLAP